jgi:uncharacterized membrane protein
VSAQPTTDHRPPTTDEPRQKSPLVTRHSSLVTPTRLLALGIAAYILVFTLAAWYKYATYQMGFDLGVHEQVLWNTTHGRVAATSVFADTESYLGIDIIPTELLLAPLYALAPSVYTMLLMQTLALALGALPVFLIVRDRFSQLQISDFRFQIDPQQAPQSTVYNLQSAIPDWAGLVFAAAYLLYLPVEYMNLYEFQIRAFATTFLLLALRELERRRFRPFLLWTLLALGCRSDVGFVVAGMGIYSILDFRLQILDLGGSQSKITNLQSKMLFGVLPILLGLGWLALCVGVLIPLFRTSPFLYTQIIYGQFGGSLGEIVRTLVTRPDAVAAYVFGGAAGAARLRYLLEMFLPFGFLLLLQPRMLLITLPIFALNLLSNTPNIHASTHYHYQALIIPFMVIGSADGLIWLIRRTTTDHRRPTNDDRPTTNDEDRNSVDASHATRHTPRDTRHTTAGYGLRTTDNAARWSLVGVVILALACNLYFRNPFFSLLTRPVDRARIAATERLLTQVPPDAALATTSTIGPHASRRERIFFFPGNVIYPEKKMTQAQFLLIDQTELLQDAKTRAERQQMLTDLSATGRLPSLAPDAVYRRVAEEQGISLWERVGQGGIP